MEAAAYFVREWSVVFGGWDVSSAALIDGDDCFGIHTVQWMTAVESADVVAVAAVEVIAVAVVYLA